MFNNLNGTTANLENNQILLASAAKNAARELSELKIEDKEKLGDLTLKVEIENLFDKDYEYADDYPMPGRSFFLGLRYDY